MLCPQHVWERQFRARCSFTAQADRDQARREEKLPVEPPSSRNIKVSRWVSDGVQMFLQRLSLRRSMLS